MIARGEAVGVLAAFDRADEGRFSDDDELLLTAFAASAANAVAMRRSVESDRLRSSIAAADAERTRWARELHDETLQGLGALRLLLSSARRSGELKQTALVVDEAIDQIEHEIENLHAIISDLRPASLDELGLRPALEALLDRRRQHAGLAVTMELELPDSARRRGLPPELESTIYRLVQESLTNVVKHARAHSARVAVSAAAATVSIEIEDDGIGFSPAPGPTASASRACASASSLSAARSRSNRASTARSSTSSCRWPAQQAARACERSRRRSRRPRRIRARGAGAQLARVVAARRHAAARRRDQRWCSCRRLRGGAREACRRPAG
jgi:two-component sensor histidine kinase